MREDLDAGELTLRVHCSSVNFKDALAATGSGKIIRRFPCVGGIDMVGEVIASADYRLHAGQIVIATSFDIGVSHHRSCAQEARVPAAWAVRLLGGLSLFEAMALGTAGFAAGLPVLRTEDNGLAQAHGPVVVSGPTGRVGSLATSVLTSLGYEVVAFTRKARSGPWRPPCAELSHAPPEVVCPGPAAPVSEQHCRQPQYDKDNHREVQQKGRICKSLIGHGGCVCDIQYFAGPAFVSPLGVNLGFPCP